MLHLIDDALEAYMRAEVPLPRNEVDVVFDRPDRDWGASVTRPTVNAFLWDVRRNSNEQEAGMNTERVNGRVIRRPPMPRVDCRYLVTAWAGDVRNEHQLLGAVMGALLIHTEMPPGYLPNGYGEVRPLPVLSIARFDGSDNTDFWTALGGELRPALDLTVTATVDAGFLAEAGPPVLRYEVETRRVDDPKTISRITYSSGSEPTEKKDE